MHFFSTLLEQEISTAALEKILVYAKAELDEYNEATDEIKFELNDTNRPDLWSAAGLARQLRSILGKNTSYSFFSTVEKPCSFDNRTVHVSAQLQKIRPFIVGFEAHGMVISDAILQEIIHLQERLTWNYGRKRKSIAMGIYPASKIQYPLKYYAADPTTTAFVPLGMDSMHTLNEILQNHPKGQEFGALLQEHTRYPCIIDAHQKILSMPPIINSQDMGSVSIGDTHLFVELTGDNLEHLHTANNIVACDLCDMGFKIRPIKTVYESAETVDMSVTDSARAETPRSCVTPYNFHHTHYAHIDHIHRVLGSTLTKKQISTSITKLGMDCEIVNDRVNVTPVPWRNDYLHAVDIIEDVMIGMGIDYFTPVPISDFTVGRLLPIETVSRRIVRIMIGLGFQEMIHNYLISKEDFIDKMYPVAERQSVLNAGIQVANPRSENHNFLRNSILPSLLHSCSVSAQAILPHKIFEIGKIAIKDSDDNYGSKTIDMLGIICSSTDAHFTLINEQVSALMYYLDIEYHITESTDSRFIAGRAAAVCRGNDIIGVMGEINPYILANWNIQAPTIACEIHVSSLLNSNE